MATERDNKVVFKMTGMTNMQFDISEYNIHTGQPWSGVKQITGGDEITMVIGAGRKGSETSADWFKTECNGGSTVACLAYGTHWPKKLNFAFIGTMRFEHGGKRYTGKNIVIGQGHGPAQSVSQNNWWLGGKGMDGLDVPHLAAGIAQTFHVKDLKPPKKDIKPPEKDIKLPAKVFFYTYGTSSNTFNMTIIEL